MSDEVKRIEGATFVCEVPKELGAVVKLEVKRGLVVARTESGHTMIVPRYRFPGEVCSPLRPPGSADLYGVPRAEE